MADKVGRGSRRVEWVQEMIRMGGEASNESLGEQIGSQEGKAGLLLLARQIY